MNLRRATAALSLALACAAPALAQPAGRRAFCPPPPGLVACTARRLGEPTTWPSGPMPLGRAVATVVRRAFVPASIVLIAPVPEVTLPRGAASPAEVLSRLARSPRYQWRDDGGVVRFEDAGVQRDPQNFLKWRLDTFTTGSDVGFDLLVLSTDLQLLPEQPRPFGGMAIEGLRPEIVDIPRRVTLKDATGGAILLDLLRGAPTFFSSVLFRGRPPLTHGDAVGAIHRWRWVPLTQPPTPPPPPAVPCAPVRVPRGAPPGWVPPPGTPCHPGASTPHA